MSSVVVVVDSAVVVGRILDNVFGVYALLRRCSLKLQMHLIINFAHIIRVLFIVIAIS